MSGESTPPSDGSRPAGSGSGASLTTGEPATLSDLEVLRRELSPQLEVVRPLGDGRSGTVYLARDPGLKRLVAVKVLSKVLAGDDVARQRFEREATAAASFSHPNAVVVYGFGYLSDDLPYLVMQYVAGGTLEERLAAEGPLPVAEVRRIVSEVADALAAAHRRGFVHRDIRPANILCDREAGSVLVSDFGVAGLLPRGDAAAARITLAGEVLGTPEYTSPEQLRGEEAAEAADVYAVGVLGYNLLSGRGPYGDGSGPGAGLAQLHAEPRPLVSLRPDVDADLAELLQRCLARDPNRRPEARYLVATLRTPPPYETDRLPMADGGKGLLDDLLRRRLPQVVAVTLVAGYAILSFIDQLADRDVLPEIAYPLALSTYGFGVATSAVIAWFHGRAGQQRVGGLEVLLIAILASGWLATCLLIALL